MPLGDLAHVESGLLVEALAMVTTPSKPVPVVVSVIPLPSANCMLPPELESVAVCVVEVDVLATVCSSLVVEPSTSVAVTVTAPAVCEIAAIPAPVKDHEPPELESVFV